MKATNRILLVALAVVVGLVSIGPPPAQAVDERLLRASWRFTADSKQAHPKKAVIAHLVTRSFELYDIAIAYNLYRDPGQGTPLRPGGRVKVHLEVLKGNRTVDFGTVSREVEIGLNGFHKYAEVRWNDPSGHEVRSWIDQTTDLLPLRLDPGDVVIWTVRMKGFGRIVGRTDLDQEFFDHVFINTDLCNCGTMNRRCPPN